jgi:hypothetical protein
MLELRPSCEHCNVCPKCGGGFTPRPIRPARNWKDDNYLGKDPAAATTRHRPVDAAVHSAFAMAIRHLPPEHR